MDDFEFPYRPSLYYYGFSNVSTSYFDFSNSFYTEFRIKRGCNMYEVLERLMKEKGVKASDVAKATGISQSVFTDWKKGRYTPKADKLYVLAKYFDVPMDVFFEPENIAIHDEKTYSKEDVTPKSDYFIELLGDEELFRLVERIVNASAEDRERFIQMGKLMGLL